MVCAPTALPPSSSTAALDNRTVADVERKAQSGAVNLLYVAPERVSMPGFRRFLYTLDLRMIAIDEAHCISEWGHDFRPDYRALAELRDLFPPNADHGADGHRHRAGAAGYC